MISSSSVTPGSAVTTPADSSSSPSKKRKRNENKSNKFKQLSFPPIPRITCNIAHSNFAELAESCPEFKAEWIKLKKRQRDNSRIGGGSTTSSFASNVDSGFNIALSRSILQTNFQLDLKCVPKGYLCPPIPNRYNYVLWINDLLEASSGEASGKYFQEPSLECSERKISPNNRNLVRKGLDLGTGTSCIYPLLLSHKNFHQNKNGDWKFLGTDIDPFSLECAQQNIDANGLTNIIQLALVPPTLDDRGGGCCRREIPPRDTAGNLNLNPMANTRTRTRTHRHTPLVTAMKQACQVYSDSDVKFDFCMTNPPFYSSASEATLARDGDNRERTDMTSNESVYPEGEIGFALDMIHDSYFYRDRITWYSLMLSKKTSLVAVEKELERVGFRQGSVRRAEFIQGKMMRWGIAWTFLLPCRRSPALKLDGGLGSFSVTLDEQVDSSSAIKEVSSRVKNFARELKMIKLKCDEEDERLVISEVVVVDDDENDREMSGWFLIDAFIECKQSDNCSLVCVRLEVHSSDFEGIEKARNIERQMEGEICRTNRKWRRIKKREHL